MDLTLSKSEVEQACVNYLSELGINTESKNIKVNLVNGRGDKGTTADISITNMGNTFNPEANTIQDKFPDLKEVPEIPKDPLAELEEIKSDESTKEVTIEESSDEKSLF